MVSGVVVANILEKTGFKLTLDVISVNPLADHPWDVLMCWHQSGSQLSTCVVEIDSLLGIPATVDACCYSSG